MGHLYDYFLFLAGAERYKAVTSGHVRNADAAVLVFDLTDKKSFEELHYWLDCINKFNKDIIIYLFGNKIDLGEIKVESDLINEFIATNNIKSYYSTSAKNGVNIKESFNKLSIDVCETGLKNLNNQRINNLRKKEKRIEEIKKDKCC